MIDDNAVSPAKVMKELEHLSDEQRQRAVTAHLGEQEAQGERIIVHKYQKGECKEDSARSSCKWCPTTRKEKIKTQREDKNTFNLKKFYFFFKQWYGLRKLQLQRCPEFKWTQPQTACSTWLCLSSSWIMSKGNNSVIYYYLKQKTVR